MSETKNPDKVKAGVAGSRVRWGEPGTRGPRLVRLTGLDPETRERVAQNVADLIATRTAER
jgi:hypothetical protein